MKKQQVDHVLRAAGRITGEKQFIIIGSQALHGTYPDLADEILKSLEVDLIAAEHSDRTEWLNAIGHLSRFQETFGYYADPVDLGTATLPEGWEGRLVDLPPGDTEGVRGLCLEPHDLAIAKYVACREKDLVFTGELARRGIVSEERLVSLLERTPVQEPVRERIRNQIFRDFHAEQDLNSVREPQAIRTQQLAADAGDDLEAIKARGRAEWLKMRGQAGQSPASKPSRSRGSVKRDELERGSGGSLDDDASE
jgi:hypothetical protein